MNTNWTNTLAHRLQKDDTYQELKQEVEAAKQALMDSLTGESLALFQLYDATKDLMTVLSQEHAYVVGVKDCRTEEK